MKKLTRKSLNELAKTMPVIEESLQMSYVGGGNGTSANPYTQAEFDNMLSNDNWNGGYVEGMRYVATNTYIYGSSVYSGSVSQMYYTFPDYVTSISSTGWDRFLSEAVGLTPLGSLVSHVSQDITNMELSILRELLEKGYNASSSFNFVKTNIPYGGTQISVYDAATGQFVTSRTVGE